MSGIICIYRIRIIICITIPTQMQNKYYRLRYLLPTNRHILSEADFSLENPCLYAMPVHKSVLSCIRCSLLHILPVHHLLHMGGPSYHVLLAISIIALPRYKRPFFFHCPHCRKILSHLPRQINKADHTVFGISFQYRCNMRELPDMIICRISVISKNGDHISSQLNQFLQSQIISEMTKAHALYPEPSVQFLFHKV